MFACDPSCINFCVWCEAGIEDFFFLHWFSIILVLFEKAFFLHWIFGVCDIVKKWNDYRSVSIFNLSSVFCSTV